MMRYIISIKKLLFLGVICMMGFINAQQQILTGIVIDYNNNELLPGASVFCLKNNKILYGTVANDLGRYKLENIIPGDYNIEAHFLGYKKKVFQVHVSEGADLKVDIILEPSSVDLSAVEIIGNLSNSQTDQVGSITKIEAKKIDHIKPVGTQEILEKIPGIGGFSDDGMGNSRINIGIRGLYPRRSSRVLVMEDGFPISPALYTYSNLYYNPPSERITGIEVIKSSAAIKYGPQTMGGVINYLTARPRKDFGGLVKVSGGTNSYYSFYAEVGGWGTDKIHPQLELLYKTADGYRENNHFNQINGTFKVRFLPDTKNDIRLKANINYENSNATYTGLTEYSFYNNPQFNPKKYDEFSVLRAALDIVRIKAVNDKLSITTKGFLSYFDRDWWREFDVFVDADTYTGDTIIPVPWYTSGDLIRVGNQENNFGILRTFFVTFAEQIYDWDHTFLGNSCNLEAGGRIYFERFIDDKKIGDEPDARDGVYYTGDPDTGDVEIVGQSHHYESFAISLYALEKIKIGSFLVITPGIRFEGFEQEKIDRLQGSIYRDKTTMVLLPGLGFNLKIKNNNLFGGIHRGFTPPSSGTLNVLSFGEVSNDSLDLEAEKSWNLEFGVRGNTDFLEFEVTAFNMMIEDLVAAGRGTAFKNLGKARSSGVENEINIILSKWRKGLPDFQVAYTFLNTEILDGIISSTQEQGEVNIKGNEMPYAPQHVLVAGISKEFDFGLFIASDVKYVSSVFSDFENITQTSNRGDQGIIPEYFLLNANVMYQLNSKWTFFAHGKNILDAIYIGSRLHSNPGQPEAWLSSGILPGPRRQVNVGIKYMFN